jgi:hypothetical protein
MMKIIQWGGAVSLAVVLAGCSLTDVEGPAGTPSTGPAVRITQAASPSALVEVVTGPASGAAFSGLVNATDRLREDLVVLQAGMPPETVVSSTSPVPPAIVVAGQPAGPGKGATSYLSAPYAERLKHWRSEVTAGRRTEAAQARGAVSAWLRAWGSRPGPGDWPTQKARPGAWWRRARPLPTRWRGWRRRTATCSAPGA